MRQSVGLFNDTWTIFTWIDKNETNEHKYVTAYTNEIPLHGIHYFEFWLHSKSHSNYIPKVFVGLCNSSEASLLEDTYKERGSLLFHSYDSQFWNSGNQMQMYSTNRIISWARNQIEKNDTIWIAIDLRQAS